MNTIYHELTALSVALPQLSERDRSFADSLLSQARAAHRANAGRLLSDKQIYWVRKLTERAAAPKPVETAVEILDFTRVSELLLTAAQHTKRLPKIRLKLADGRKVVVKLAGVRTGTVNVTDGRPFGDNTFYGRVTSTGVWQPSEHADSAIVALLRELAADPAKLAGEQGLAAHHCVFCARELTDPRSKLVGYGEQCASNYGLPWGATGEEG